MKLLSMKTQNFMRCVFAEVRFDKDIVEITGNNGEGKSSFAKSIWALFGGKDAIPEQPVTEGAEVSVLKAELDGDFVLTRYIYPNRETKLELRNKEGGKYKTPQEILDGFNLKFGFWPQQFIDEKPQKQAETLRNLLGLDFTKQDMRQAALREERTEIGREGNNFKAKLANASYDENLPEQEQSTDEVYAKLKAAVEAKEKKDKFTQVILTEQNSINLANRRIEDLKTEIEGLKDKIAQSDKRIVEYKEKESAIELTDISSFEVSLKQLAELNAAIRRNNEVKANMKMLQNLRDAYDGLTSQIKEVDEEKETALKSAKFPIDGLGFSEFGLTFNGKPFEQASTAQKWEMAIAVGFALNPELKLVYIEHGSLLDKNTVARVEKLVQQYGGQLLIETVGDSKTAVVWFESGVAHFRTEQENITSGDESEERASL